MRPLAFAVLALMLGIGNSSALAGYTAVDLYAIRPPAGWSTAWRATFEPMSTGGQVAGYTGTPNPPGNRAVFWDASGAATYLHPPGNTGWSSLEATSGAWQVGEASTPDNSFHAFLWHGTAASALDLNPAGYALSKAHGASGTQQVGEARKDGFFHAMLWSGTASSAVDLGPSAETISAAYATDGVHQVGYAVYQTHQHAVLWTGTAASAIDLGIPAGFESTWAYAVNGDQQVGSAYNGPLGIQHAMLWRGTAESAVDLNPAGAPLSNAWGTNGAQQVGGVADRSFLMHAAVWSGTAGSVVDLSRLLPAGWNYSEAYAIDANGNVFGIAADPSGLEHAVEWQNVPEPASAALLLVAAPALFLRRRTL